MLYRNLLSIIILLVSIHLTAQPVNRNYAKIEILDDLDYLYTSLKEAHYNLYAYTTESKFDSIYHQLKGTIDKDSLDLLRTTNILQQLISTVNNGHTEIDFPIVPYMNYAYNNGTVFPLEIIFEQDKYLIRKNFSKNDNIKIDSEILTINGVSIETILSKIYAQISAERTYLKNSKIELYSFPRYYWQVFGQQDYFKIEIKTGTIIKEYSITAVKLIEDFEMKRTDVMNAKMKLKLFDNSAYINPGDFDGDELLYQEFIDSAFTVINNRNSRNLIIDLRNNRGGNNSFSDYLVAYIANQPFRWNSNFRLKSSAFLKQHTRVFSDTTDAYFRSILSHKDNEIYEYDFGIYAPQPINKRYKGKVYVLINRQSHSQATLTAAQVQDYNFGTIVGEETGDYPSLYASQFQYLLPNTKIPVKVAKGYIIRVNGSEKARGVQPDIVIKDYLLGDNDEILEGLLEMLR